MDGRRSFVQMKAILCQFQEIRQREKAVAFLKPASCCSLREFREYIDFIKIVFAKIDI